MLYPSAIASLGNPNKRWNGILVLDDRLQTAHHVAIGHQILIFHGSQHLRDNSCDFEQLNPATRRWMFRHQTAQGPDSRFFGLLTPLLRLWVATVAWLEL